MTERASHATPGRGALAEALADAGVLTPVDRGVAETVCRLTGDASDEVYAAVALAVRAPRHGHVCVELDRVAEGIVADPERWGSSGDTGSAPPWPEMTGWVSRLQASPAVRTVVEGDDRDHDAVAPLVLDGQRLYLDRYWRYEQRLLDRLRELAGAVRDDTDPAEVREWLDRLFGAPSGEAASDGTVDRQRLAAALATMRALTVISGGPGTGKTTTIVRILALLLATVRRDPAEGPLRIALAAPTGKAAGRMQEAVRQAIDELDVDAEVVARLAAVPASTLHRLLGWRRENSTRFRHDAREPLPYDVVVVDEASMVSLAMMAKLVDAVPPTSRLLLVGDREQLVSVEAGAVLGDICGPLRPGTGTTLRLSAETAAAAGERYGQDVTGAAEVVDRAGIWDSIVQLDRFYRFGQDSGIGSVARAIQRVASDADEVVETLRGERTERPGTVPYTDVALVAPSDAGVPGPVRDAVVDGYRPFVEGALRGDDAAGLLAALDRLRLLVALRRGPEGVAFLNRAVEAWLAESVPGFDPRGSWYLGRPVMVTSNDYGIRLFNGDVGVVVDRPDAPGERAVAFPTADGGVRYVGPARLPEHETVFAMTVHKSQGSQFDRVVLVFPRTDTPILTRELVYTGITRAKEHVTVVADEDILRAAVRRPVQRASGLADRLWR